MFCPLWNFVKSSWFVVHLFQVFQVFQLFHIFFHKTTTCLKQKIIWKSVFFREFFSNLAAWKRFKMTFFLYIFALFRTKITQKVIKNSQIEQYFHCSFLCSFWLHNSSPQYRTIATLLNLRLKMSKFYFSESTGPKQNFYGSHRFVTHFLFAVFHLRGCRAKWGNICSFAGYRRNFYDTGIGHILQYSLKFWWSCIKNEKNLCY